MPTKPKYNYDIRAIQALENQARSQGREPSLRSIYRELGYPETLAHLWKLRNYVGEITYSPKV